MIAALLLLAAVPVAAMPPDAPPAPPGVVISGGEDPAAACYRHARRGAVDEDAVAVCTRAIEEAAYPINRTASTVNRGVVHYNGGRYALAAADFGAVIERGTKNARVHVNRGLAHEQMGRTDPRYDALARADYEAALALRPDEPVATRRLGELAKPPLERTPLRARVTV